MNFWKKYGRLVFGVMALTGAILAFRGLSLPHVAEVQAYIDEWGATPRVMFVLVEIGAVVACLPVTPLILAAGLAFGPWWGTLLATVGANVGATAAFLAARGVARTVVEGQLDRQEWFARLKKAAPPAGFTFVLFARLVPAFPSNGLSYGCGLVPLSWRHYALGTLIGTLPSTLAYAYLGATAGMVIDAATYGRLRFADLPPEVRSSVVIVVGMLLILSCLPLLLKKLGLGQAGEAGPRSDGPSLDKPSLG